MILPRKNGKEPFMSHLRHQKWRFQGRWKTLIESGIDRNVFTEHSTRSAAARRAKKVKNQLKKYYKLGAGGEIKHFTLCRTYRTFLLYTCSFIMSH